MRLPVIGGDDSRIDETAALRMVDTAMTNGINYYDTAWGYHGENSELVMTGGKIMQNAPDINSSTVEERRAYIKGRFPCIADCDMCGLCTVFRGKDAEQAYDDYIMGKRSFMDVSKDY